MRDNVAYFASVKIIFKIHPVLVGERKLREKTCKLRNSSYIHQATVSQRSGLVLTLLLYNYEKLIVIILFYFVFI